MSNVNISSPSNGWQFILRQFGLEVLVPPHLPKGDQALGRVMAMVGDNERGGLGCQTSVPLRDIVMKRHSRHRQGSPEHHSISFFIFLRVK